MEDATAADHLVAGIILITAVLARALFDTGVSHSFISRAFASLHGLEVGSIPRALEVQIFDHVLCS